MTDRGRRYNEWQQQLLGEWLGNTEFLDSARPMGENNSTSTLAYELEWWEPLYLTAC